MTRTNSGRFEVLDSWRGICAICVAILHFNIISHVFELPFFYNSWLFVDFFFVLSGFVISHAYFNFLTSPSSLITFMVRRFGRLWPLHVATLLFLIVWEILKATIILELHMPARPSDVFREPWLAAGSIVANIGLVQSIGFYHFFCDGYLPMELSKLEHQRGVLYLLHFCADLRLLLSLF